MGDQHSSDPYLSVVVVAHNMAREIPRTIRSLSPQMQRDVAAEDYEIILMDNGSTPAFDIRSCQDWGVKLTVRRMSDPTSSPVAAINEGVRTAKGSLIGVLIDGARMASPGLLSGVLQAARLDPRPVIGTLGFHLGPEVQMHSVKKGYCARQEDELLKSVNWTEDGYRLFQISVFAGSSGNGWFAPISESNALFMPRPLWAELGGYDEQFQTPGGGLVNLDTWARACRLPNSRLIILLGEGTFHQVHGGIATNARRESPVPMFHEEYVNIRGQRFTTPAMDPLFLGTLNASALPSIAWSASRLCEARSSA